MIVLDEQLLGRGVERALGRWYRGSVRFVTELRPGTIIKDEAIPALLRQQSRPTFVTINETDFWLKAPVSGSFCVICVAVPDSRASAVPSFVRRLLRHPEFRTKAQRMGKVARVSETVVSWYSLDNPTIRRLERW